MQNKISTVRRKIILSIMAIVAAALSMLLLFGCAKEYTEDDLAKEFPVLVIYDYQGGKYENEGVRRVRVKEGSIIPEPSTKDGVRLPTRTGYSLKTFVLAETDEEGNPLYDEETKSYVPGDKEWDFKTDRVTDKNIVICAVWWKNYTIKMFYKEHDKTDYNMENVIVIDNIARERNGSPVSPRESSFQKEGYTFLSYNMERDGGDDTAIPSFPHKFTSDDFKYDDGLTAYVYGDCLKGEYILAKSSSDLTMSVFNENTNVYLLDDIDFSIGGRKSVYNDSLSGLPRTYNGKFYGNGHKLSNFSINLSMPNATYTDFGLFRALGASAVIDDVKFENIDLSYEIDNPNNVPHINVGLIAGDVHKDAVVKDVKIIGNSTYKFSVAVGITPDMLTRESILFGSIADGNSNISGNSYDDSLEIILSDGVYSADNNYIAYVNYKLVGGVAVVEKVYAIAELQSDGSYAGRTCQYMDREDPDNELIYIFVRRGLKTTTYRIELSVDGETISATVTKTEA